MIFGVIGIFIPASKTFNIWYCALGTLTMITVRISLKLFIDKFSIISCLSLQYLIIDTQMMVGGGRSREISPEDYVLAAMQLYIDIIYLFVYILQLVSANRS